MNKRRKQKKTKSEKKKSKFKLGKLLFFLVIISILGYGIYSYTVFSNIKSINPLSSSNADYYLLSHRKDALEKTLIVFEEYYNEQEVIQSAYIYAVNKEKSKAVLIYIPGRIEYTGVDKDFGSGITVSTFKYAGEFIQKGKGFEYAIWQFQQMLGTNIDNYIWFSAETMQLFEEKLGQPLSGQMYAQYFSNGFELPEEVFFLNSFCSRLSWINLILSSSELQDSNSTVYSSFSTFLSSVEKLRDIYRSTLHARPYVIDFSQSEYVTIMESASGVGLSSQIDISAFDSVWRDFVDSMIDRNLEKERVRVEVYNGSGLSGYASQYARKIRNSGLEVVRYDNAPDLVERTQFYVPYPKEYKNSMEVIREIFPGGYDIVQGRPQFMTTGDIVIILGKDIPTVYSFQ